MRKNDESIRTDYTFCRICESLCGLEIDVVGNQIHSIRPDNSHVATRGFACPKGLKQHKMYGSPDRLRHPMKKENGLWKKTSWKDAIHGIGRRVKDIKKRYSSDSIAMYVGTAAGFGVLHPIFAQGFMDGLGSKNMYSSATQDCANKFAVAERIYGHPFTQPFPDLLHTNCFIIVGANPVVSKWSFLQVPNPSIHLKEMERRGCRIYVVDPRKTETAKVAGHHVFIRPNTDPFFFLAFLDEMNRQGGVKKEMLAHIQGVEQVLNLAKQWPSDRTSGLTGISNHMLQKMVKDFLTADGAVMYSSTGVNMGRHGSISFWIQECINILSGNIDRRGGALVGKGIIDFPRFGVKNGILLRKDKSRIGQFHSTNDAFPGGLLADEILTPGNKQIRALFVTGGNPLITMANSNRLKEAFDNLELLVTLDIYPNETGVAGHYMLPCTSPLERPDLPFIFPLMLGLQVKPYLQATNAIVKPDAEQKDEATIYYMLSKACGTHLFGSRAMQFFLDILYFINRKIGLPQRFILNALLKISGQPGFRKLLNYQHGLLRKEHEPGSFIGKRVYTDNGKMRLAPKKLMQASKLLDNFFLQESAVKDRFKLISKRDVTTHNSWTHNIEEFTKGDRYTNYLYMHPRDAARVGVGFKELVDVSTSSGTVRVPVKITDQLMPGTVALPHGWGHQDSLMQIANKTSGVNVNILMADGIDAIEPVSGMSQMTGLTVDVCKARGKLAHEWSGIEKEST